MATTSRRTGTTTLRTLTIFPSQGCRGRRKRYPKQAFTVKFRKGRELRPARPAALVARGSAVEVVTRFCRAHSQRRQRSPQRQHRIVARHRGAMLLVELLQL